MPTQRERIEGGLYGLLVGDALGVPYEFHPAAELPPPERIEFAPPDWFRRAHASVPPGTWSDDGAQALCLLDALLAEGRFEPQALAARLLDWLHSGYLAADGVVFDVGIQTSAALRALEAGAPPLEAGPADERRNGNGSLMRVLPLALWHDGTDAELARDAMLQSRVTHGHPRSQACCAAYCLWARRTFEGAAEPWPDAVAALRSIWPDDDPARRELETAIRPDEPAHGRGGGYVVDCLNSARMVIDAGGDYEATVRAAVALGDDTDTTAAVAGGIAGLRDGIGAIPRRWLDALRGRRHVEPLLAALLAHRGLG